jgi:hypothetical protein
MDHIGLLSSDGAVDQGFIGKANGNVYSSILSQNNKAVIGGAFTEYSGYVRNGVARISFDIYAEVLTPVDNIEIPLGYNLNVYPNPAVSAITIDHLESGSVFKIYNSSGIEMFSGVSTDEKPTVELNDYATGVYFMIAEKNGIRSSTKFIVSK